MSYVGEPPASSYVPPPDPGPPPPGPPDPDPTTTWQGSFTATEAFISPGDVVEVPDGTYAESFTLSKAGTVWLGGNGVIIDLSGEGIAIQAAGVVIEGDDVRFGTGGMDEGIQIMGSDGAAIELNGDRIIVTVDLHDNVEEGYIIHGSDCTALGGANHDNDSTGDLYDSSEQGAGKANADRFTMDGVHIYNIGLGGADDSAGQGAWWDSISSPPLSRFSSGTLKNCLIHDVWYAGAMFEVSRDFEAYDNVIHHCGSTGDSYWGAGLLIATAQNADLHDNLIAYCPNWGVRVLCQSRSDRPGVTTSVRTHDSTFIRNGHAIGYETDDSGSRSAMFAVSSGNVAYANIFNEDDVEVHWNQTTHTSLTEINALPGGGGSSTITEAAADAILAAPPIGPAISA